MVTVANRPRLYARSAQSLRASRDVLTFAERSEAAKRGALTMTPAERSARTRKGWLKRKRAMQRVTSVWQAGTTPATTPWSSGKSMTPQVAMSLPFTADYLHHGGSLGAGTAMGRGNTASVDTVIGELRTAIADDPNGDLIVDTASLITGQPGDAFFTAIAAGLVASANGYDADTIRFEMIDAANTYIEDQNDWMMGRGQGGPVQGGTALADASLVAVLKSLPAGNLLANQLVANYWPMAMAGTVGKALNAPDLAERMHKTVEFLHERRNLSNNDKARADAAIDNWLATTPTLLHFTPPTLASMTPGANTGTSTSVPKGITPLAGTNAIVPGSGVTAALTTNDITARRQYIQALRHNKDWQVGGPNDTLTIYNNGTHAQKSLREAQRQQLVATIFAEAANRGVQRRPKGQRRALITGGPAGAGKSFMLEEHQDELDGPWLVVNVDDITDRMIGLGMVPTMPGLSPSESVHLVRNEALQLRDSMMAQAVSEGWDIAYDTTMMDNSLATQAISQLHNNGYLDPAALFVSVDTARSIENVEDRWVIGVETWLNKGDLSPVDGGRYVSANSIGRNVPHSDPSLPSASAETFIDMAKAGTFSRALVIDNQPVPGNDFPRTVVAPLDMADWPNASLQAVATGATPNPVDKMLVAVAEGEIQRRTDGRSANGQGLPNPPTGANPPPTVTTPSTPAPGVRVISKTGGAPVKTMPFTLQNFTADPRFQQFTAATGYAGTGGDVTRGNKVQKRIVTTLGKFSTQTITPQQIDAVLEEWDKANKVKPISGQTPGQFNHFLYNTSLASFNVAAGQQVTTFAGAAAPTATTPTPPVPQPSLAALHGANTNVSITTIVGDSRYQALNAGDRNRLSLDLNRQSQFSGPWTAEEADAYLNEISKPGNARVINAQQAITALRTGAPPGTTTTAPAGGFVAQLGSPSAHVSLISTALLMGHPLFQTLTPGWQASATARLQHYETSNPSRALTAREVDNYLSDLSVPLGRGVPQWSLAGDNIRTAIQTRTGTLPPPYTGATPAKVIPNLMWLSGQYGALATYQRAGLRNDPRYLALSPVEQGIVVDDLAAAAKALTYGINYAEADAYLDAFTATRLRTSARDALDAQALKSFGRKPRWTATGAAKQATPGGFVESAVTFGNDPLTFQLPPITKAFLSTHPGYAALSNMEQDQILVRLAFYEQNNGTGFLTPQEVDDYLEGWDSGRQRGTMHKSALEAISTAIQARTGSAPPAYSTSGPQPNIGRPFPTALAAQPQAAPVGPGYLSAKYGANAPVVLFGNIVTDDPRIKALGGGAPSSQGITDMRTDLDTYEKMVGTLDASMVDAYIDAYLAQYSQNVYDEPAARSVARTALVKAINAVKSGAVPVPPPPAKTSGNANYNVHTYGSGSRFFTRQLNYDPRVPYGSTFRREAYSDLNDLVVTNEEADAYIEAWATSTAGNERHDARLALIAMLGHDPFGETGPVVPQSALINPGASRNALSRSIGSAQDFDLNNLTTDPRFVVLDAIQANEVQTDLSAAQIPIRNRDADRYLDAYIEAVIGKRAARDEARTSINQSLGYSLFPPTGPNYQWFVAQQGAGTVIPQTGLGIVTTHPAVAQMTQGEQWFIQAKLSWIASLLGGSLTTEQMDAYIDAVKNPNSSYARNWNEAKRTLAMTTGLTQSQIDTILLRDEPDSSFVANMGIDAVPSSSAIASDPRLAKMPSGFTRLILDDFADPRWAERPNAQEADAYIDYIVRERENHPRLNKAAQVQLAQGARAEIAKLRLGANYKPGDDAFGTTRAGLKKQPPPKRLATGIFTTAKGARSGTTITLAELQADPRYQAQIGAIQREIDNDWNNVNATANAGPWTPEEADAYLDALMATNPPPAASTATISGTTQYVDPARAALLVAKAQGALPPVVAGSTAQVNPTQPTPPVPIPPALLNPPAPSPPTGPALTNTHSATDKVSMAEIQQDPRYLALSAQDQGTALADLSQLRGTGTPSLVTAEEADAYLNGWTVSARPGFSPGQSAAQMAVADIMDRYFVTNAPTAGGNPGIPIPTASMMFRNFLLNDPRAAVSQGYSKADINQMQSDLVMQERNKGTLLTAGEIDAYLDGFYTAGLGATLITPTHMQAAMAAGQARLAEPGMPFDPRLNPTPPSVQNPTVPTPAATPTAPAAPSPGQAPALPASAVGLHNAWATDPRASFLFVHPNSTTQQASNSATPIPLPAPNNAYKRIVAAIDDAGPSLGLTQAADLDEAADIALSRYAKEWHDSVAAGNDPAQMGAKFGKWRYVARTLALADIYEQMDLAKRNDVTIPPAMATILQSQYYLTAARKVRAQNLASPLQRIGVPTGAPVGGTTLGVITPPAGVPSVSVPPTAVATPKPGQWPMPAHIVDFGAGSMDALAAMPMYTSAVRDKAAQQTRRANWIGSGTDTASRNRNKVANAADRFMGHSGHSQVPGSNTSGGFEGIREAAHTMTGVMFNGLTSQTYQSGNVSQLDYDDAKILMQAAAQADLVPDRNGSGEHKMYRGMVLTKAQADRIAVGGPPLIEPLGQFTLNPDYARAYMDLRTTGAMRTGNRDQSVLIEVEDAHGLPTSALNYTAQDDNHLATDEIVSSGEYEIIDVSKSMDPIVEMNPGGSGYTVTSRTREVLHVKVRQVSPGWDFSGNQLTLVGAPPPVTPSGQQLPPGGSLTVAGPQFVATVGRNRRVITPPSQLGAAKPKVKALIEQSDAASRGVTLRGSTTWTTGPHTLAGPVLTGPGPAVDAITPPNRHLPPRGALPLPSTFVDADAYWAAGGQVAPGAPSTVEVMTHLLHMGQGTPVMGDVGEAAQAFGVELVGAKPTAEQVAFYSSFLKSYETGDDWDTALGKALDAVDQAAKILNEEILRPAQFGSRKRPSHITDDNERQWISDLVAMNDTVGFAFMDTYTNNGGNAGKPGSASDAYARAARAIDSLEVAGRISAKDAKDLRVKVGTGLPKPVATSKGNLAPSGLQLVHSAGAATTNVYVDVSGMPIPPSIHTSITKPRVAKASQNAGYRAPVTTPWDPDLQTPFAIALGLPQDTDTLMAQWSALDTTEQKSVKASFSTYPFRRMSSVRRSVNPQQIAEMTAILNAYIAARGQYGNAHLSGPRLSAGRTLAQKALAAETARTANNIALAKAAALAARGAPAPAVVVPAKPGRPARAAYDALPDVQHPRPMTDPNVMRPSRYAFGDYLGFVRDPVVQEQIAIGTWGDPSEVVDEFEIDDYMRSQYHGDKVMIVLATVQGFTDKADIVTEDEMDEYIAAGEWAIYRGLQQRVAFQATRDGVFSYSSGHSGNGTMYGRGTYWYSMDQSGGAAAADQARSTGYQSAQSVAGAGNPVIRATFRPDARVAREADFVNMVNAVIADTSLTPEERNFLLGPWATKTTPASAAEVASAIDVQNRSVLDPAILALAFGYDAYISSGYKGTPHSAARPTPHILTVLNRTALRMQSTEAKRG